MMEFIKTINDAVNGFVWGLPMLVLLISLSFDILLTEGGSIL